MRRLTLWLILLLTLAVQAQEQTILTATSDDSENTDSLILILDDQSRPTHLLVRNSRKPEKRYSTQQVSRGVVLNERQGREIITLKAQNFDPEDGAELVLRYLVNGIPPQKFDQETLALRRVSDRWQVFRGDSPRPLKSIHFITNRLMVLGVSQAVGIRQIRFIHQPR